MIAKRPDWCISRQRFWGVPIVVFFCEGCNKLVNSKEINRTVSFAFRTRGIGRVVQAASVGDSPCWNQVRKMRRLWLPKGDGHHRRVVRERIVASGRPRSLARAFLIRRISTSKAETSIAGGSTLPCSAPSDCMKPHRSAV